MILISILSLSVCEAGKYYVGGTVSGLSGTLVIQQNSAEELTLTSNTAWVFTEGLVTDDTYTISVKTQPDNQTCNITNGSGTISEDNVTNVSISCSDNANPDTTAPTVLAKTINGVYGGGQFQLSWAASSDETTATANLQYIVYYKTGNVPDQMDTVAEVKTGTAANAATANLTALNVTLANAQTTFNVLVRDEAGNESIYTQRMLGGGPTPE